MKIQIENLKAQMQGRNLTIHQKADALIEFNKLLDYVEELEQCNIANVVGRSEQFNCLGGNYAKGIKPCSEWCGEDMCQKSSN